MKRIDISVLEEFVKKGIVPEESMKFIESYCLIEESSQPLGYNCGRPKKQVSHDKLIEVYSKWIFDEINLIEAARSLGVAKQTFYNVLKANGLAKKDDVRINNRVAEIQTGINGNRIVLRKSMSRDDACGVIKKAIEYTEPKFDLEVSTDNFIKYAYIYILIELGKQGKWKKIKRTVLCEELEVSIDSYYTYTRESKECELFKIFCRGVIKNIRFC